MLDLDEKQLGVFRWLVSMCEHNLIQIMQSKNPDLAYFIMLRLDWIEGTVWHRRRYALYCLSF